MCLTSLKFNGLKSIDGELVPPMQGHWRMSGYKAYDVRHVVDGRAYAGGLVFGTNLSPSQDPMVAEQRMVAMPGSFFAVGSTEFRAETKPKYESGWHIFRNMFDAVFYSVLHADEYSAIFATEGKDVVASGTQGDKKTVDVCRMKRDLYLVGFAIIPGVRSFTMKQFSVDFYRYFSTDAFNTESLYRCLVNATKQKPLTIKAW